MNPIEYHAEMMDRIVAGGRRGIRRVTVEIDSSVYESLKHNVWRATPETMLEDFAVAWWRRVCAVEDGKGDDGDVRIYKPD